VWIQENFRGSSTNILPLINFISLLHTHVVSLLDIPSSLKPIWRVVPYSTTSRRFGGGSHPRFDFSPGARMSSGITPTIITYVYVRVRSNGALSPRRCPTQRQKKWLYRQARSTAGRGEEAVDARSSRKAGKSMCCTGRVCKAALLYRERVRGGEGGGGTSSICTRDIC